MVYSDYSTEAARNEMSNAIRFLSVDMVERANSGHPGMPSGMSDVASVLFSKFFKTNPEDPKWFDRDRFVLSAGHGSALLYSVLYLMGFEDITIDDLKNFRQLNSKTAGHPEYGHLAGIDMTTGPLGQGITSAVGMALSERHLNAKFGDDLCNHYTYAICGDGCLEEGISEEAISLAGHLHLNKLIVFWDNNEITIDGPVSLSSSTNQIKRFEANGWNTISIDGHSHKEIKEAIASAQNSARPTLISCKTIIGFGAPNKEGTSKVHGSPLGADEIKAMRENLNWIFPPFEIPVEIKQAWLSAGKKSQEEYKTWLEKSKNNQAFLDHIHNRFTGAWEKELDILKEQAIKDKTKVATRKASQMCLEKIVPNIPQMIGGSADLNASNLTKVSGMEDISHNFYKGNNVAYGVREHAMAAIMNGMSLHGGMIPYGGTFFVFSDYCRPAMRLSALMGTPVIYVMTHDSIGVGEDGPTHQPVEHLASFRAMPNIFTMRPCDVVETAEAWEIAVKSERTPSVLALTRQNLPLLRTDCKENMVEKGGYIISDVSNGANRKATIIATGSEVSLAVEAQAELKKQNIEVAVVSMPCTELFDLQDQNYQTEVLGLAPRIAVEAAAKFGWEKYVGLDGDIIGMDGFGASGPADQLYEHFGITKEELIDAVKNTIKK